MSQPVLFVKEGACSLGSQVMLELLKIPYSVCLTDEQIRKSPEFKTVNPIGRVGALRDDNILVAENSAILFHLSDKYGKSENITTFKLGSPERAEAYQWLSYFSSTLHVAFGECLFAKCDDALQKETIRQKLISVLGYVNDYLSTNTYFVGNTQSFVDGQAYGLLRWANRSIAHDNKIEINNFPHIVSFINRMEKVPEVQNALAIETNQPAKASHSGFTGYWTIPTTA